MPTSHLSCQNVISAEVEKILDESVSLAFSLPALTFGGVGLLMTLRNLVHLFTQGDVWLFHVIALEGRRDEVILLYPC